MAKRRKCYYDIVATLNSSPGLLSRTLAFRVTQLNATSAAGVNGAIDRYNNFLDDVAALTGGSPNPRKTMNAVSAWVQMNRNAAISEPSGVQDTNGSVAVAVDYIPATGNATTAVGLPYRTAGGVTVADKRGMDPIYTRHFRARVVLTATITLGSAVTVSGTLIVQRPHSIEV